MDINAIHRLLCEEGGGSNKILLLGRSVTFDTASTYIKDPAMKHILADDYFALLHPAGDSLVPPFRCVITNSSSGFLVHPACLLSEQSFFDISAPHVIGHAGQLINCCVASTDILI